MTPDELANLERLEAAYREWNREHPGSSEYSDERHRLSCAYLRHGPALLAAVAERDALKTELDGIRETFGGAPSWASVAKNLIDARAQRDAAEDENERQKAQEAEWVAAAARIIASRDRIVVSEIVEMLSDLVRTAGKAE